MASHETSSEREELEVTLKLPGAAEGTLVQHTVTYMISSETTSNWVLFIVNYCCQVLQCTNSSDTTKITDGKNL